MNKSFVFLVLEEHPYGREMFMQLLNAGHVPTAIIEEAGPIADEEREEFLTRIKSHRVAPTFTQLLEDRDIPLLKVSNPNKRECRELLTDLEPDLRVLGGTRILKKCILEIPLDGMLNSHSGPLP